MAKTSISSTKSSQRRSQAAQQTRKPTQKAVSNRPIFAKQADIPDLQNDRLPTSPNLFKDSQTTHMTVALPIWEASNILTQGRDLSWSTDSNGKLCYAREVGDDKGAIYFWVTENIDDEHPAALAGAAALACIDTFDIRAACMHLLYAAHATRFEKPWEQDLIIDDRQIEDYLGLKKRTDKNRQQKLALIEEIAKQPSKITTYVSWPNQSKKKGFTVEEGRLWHIVGTRYHYQQNLLGHKELTGMTFIVRPGQWAKYFLNEEEEQSYCGNLSTALLQAVMRVWQHREGAARLMIWLLFKSRVDRQFPLNVLTLMKVAYGAHKVHEAKKNSDLRKKLSRKWDEDLLSLSEHGWQITFDSQTYPESIQPMGFGRKSQARPRGFFEKLLSAWLWIDPPQNLSKDAAALPPANLEHLGEPNGDHPLPIMAGSQVKQIRIGKGWSQRKLASLTGISQGMVCLIENEARAVSPENNERFKQVFELE